MPNANILIKPASSACNLRCRYCFYRSISQSRTETGCGMMTRETLEAARLLEKHKIEYNIVSVVTALSAEDPAAVYRYFKKKDFRYLLFIPCLDGSPDLQTKASLTPQMYGKFFNTLFDLWYEDYMAGHIIDIRMFSNWVQMAAGYRAEECGMSGECSCYFAVEGNGKVYPCDFYAMDKWLLGTVEDAFDELIQGETAQTFIRSAPPVDSECQSCRHQAQCRGGCRRWRESFAEGQLARNHLCEAYTLFFEHCEERNYRLGRALRTVMSH